MENGVLAWLEDETWKGLSVSGAMVNEKMMCWYNHYRESWDERSGGQQVSEHGIPWTS
jgi:hypothetical protein